MIPMGSNSDELLGQNYEEVVEILTVAGFTNIHTEGTEDLSYAEISEEGKYIKYISSVRMSSLRTLSSHTTFR